MTMPALRFTDLLWAQKLESEVLFLGFGPITLALATQLIATGNKVTVITENPQISMTRDVKLPKELFRTITWSNALGEQITCQSTYISWRQSPQNRMLGPQMISWLKSDNIKTEKIHHLSSASVYTGKQDLYSETDYDFREVKKKLNSKQELEKFVFDISLEKKIKFVNYRISNVYGAGLSKGFINESLSSFKSNDPIKIYKKMDLVRDYLSIEDLIAALMELRCIESTNETLNISTGRGVAMSEIVEFVKATKKVQFQFFEVESPGNVILRSVLSSKKLEETISWKPQRLEESLEKLFAELI